jgi:hypothetical protein
LGWYLNLEEHSRFHQAFFLFHVRRIKHILFATGGLIMKRIYFSIMLILIAFGILLIWPKPASAQGTVPYITPLVDGILGANDWYVSDVNVTWLFPPELTVYQGCEDTLINQDTPPDGLELNCVVVDASNEYYSGSIVIKRDATPPTVATNLLIDPPLSLNEGDSYQVDASASYDDASGVASIQWSLDGDGLFDDGNPAVYQGIDGFANADANPEILVAQVIDQAGNTTETPYPVVVLNLPPVFGALQDIGPVYGSYNLSAPFSDPGVLDTHTGSIDWGDDTLEAGLIVESSGSGFLQGEHTYDHRGVFTYTLTLQDKDGAVITRNQRVNVVSPTGVSLPISASFTHVSGPTLYSTVFNYITPLLLNADDTQAEAILGLDPGGCFGMTWFETGGANPQKLGSMATCLTDPAVSDDDLNAWLANDQGLPGPELHIPLEFSGIGPNMAQVWTNPDALTVGIFVQGGESPDYLRYADLVFPPGEFTLTTGIDPTYRPSLSLAGTPSLTNIDPITWVYIQASLDPDDLLPQISAPGTLLEFSGGSMPIEYDPETLSGGMGLLQDSIGAYTYDNILPLHTNLQLNQVLDKVSKAWRDIRDNKALLELNKFIDDVVHLVDQRQLLNDDGVILIGEAKFLIDGMLDWQNPGELDPDPSTYCGDTPGSCPNTFETCQGSPDYKVFFIDDDSDALEPDGSPGAPFPTIKEALDQAESLDSCGVLLNVQPGTYSGDLNITRHTQIHGEGMPSQIEIQGLISNRGPYVLQIFNVKIIGNPLIQPTGILVDHPCADVALGNVIVQGVYGYGIRQDGGSLIGTNLEIRDTKATPQYLTHGTGMYLSCGVQAKLVWVKLTNNQSTGLQVVGAGTNVEIHDLRVEGTSMHPSYLATAETEFNDPGYGLVTSFAPILGTGGVHIRNEAFLWVTGFDILDNISSGINVAYGASARFEYGTVSGSRLYHGVNADGEWWAGHGHNTLSTLGGHLNLFSVDVRNAESCGNLIAMDGDLFHWIGEVAYNDYGSCIFVPGYDLHRLAHGVNYHDNLTQNITTSEVGVPAPIGP